MAFMWKNDMETPRGSTISVFLLDLFIKKGVPTIGCFCNIYIYILIGYNPHSRMVKPWLNYVSARAIDGQLTLG